MTRAARIAALVAATTVAGLAVAQKPAVDSGPQQSAAPPGLPAPLTLASRPGATGSERLFVQRCGMCHGPGGMGTGLLARRSDQPLLEKRTDLEADFVVQAVRAGIGNMPAIPPGEVSKPELQAIATYLAAKRAKTP